MREVKNNSDRTGTLFLLLLFLWLIFMIATALTPKKPKGQKIRSAHPIAYHIVGDSVRVYFVWCDSLENRILSADTFVTYHKNNIPETGKNIDIWIKK
jgi:hypothetical protein